MKVLKIIALVVLLGFVGIQFVPTEPNLSDVVPDTDFMSVNQVAKDIEHDLRVSCYDCHSNNTQYPWYSKVQPIAWFLEGHIKEGKAELNFNEWDSLSSRRKASKLRSIVKQIENGEMPLASYTLIHKEATFSEKEAQRVVKYMENLKDSL